MHHDLSAYDALLSRDERRILSWSEDSTVRLWDIATGQQIGPAPTHNEPHLLPVVNGALLTKDGRRILSWSLGGTLLLWDAATGQQIGPAMKHDDWVGGVLLTKDERRILSWSWDGTVRLWDIATGQQIGPAMEHDGRVAGAMLTKDERRILSWSEDHTLRLWDAAWPDGNLLEVVCALLDHNVNDASKRYGITIADPICTPASTTFVPDWSLIERAPAQLIGQPSFKRRR
jgi:WD40 repeat protein